MTEEKVRRQIQFMSYGIRNYDGKRCRNDVFEMTEDQYKEIKAKIEAVEKKNKPLHSEINRLGGQVFKNYNDLKKDLEVFKIK